MLTMSRTGLGQDSDVGTQFMSFSWVRGTQLVKPSLQPPKVHVSRKLEQVIRHRHTGVKVLGARVKA